MNAQRPQVRKLAPTSRSDDRPVAVGLKQKDLFRLHRYPPTVLQMQQNPSYYVFMALSWHKPSE
ncbi:MAG: hypothetical protein K8R59_00460 [Thermoanaerobaculales bacterium]|nr:hypothetical protein [Thermoanaerobaculales bacterium]